MKGLAVVFAALFFLTSCGRRKSAEPAAAGPPVQVEVETLRAAPVDQVYEAAGTVRARNQAIISARISGYLTSVRVRPGDRVKQGQLLATVESAELEAQVRRAQAGQDAARSGIVEAERGTAAAQANARLAGSTFARYQDLLGKKSVSAQEFEEAEARHQSAQAALGMANARLREARSRAEQAGAELSAARTVRSYAALTAPFAGLVAEKKADPGTLAYPGLPILVLEQDDRFHLEVPVEESRAGAVRLGQQVKVWLDAVAGELEAKVEEIVPAADPASRTVLVKLALPASPKLGLRSGLYGKAGFIVGRREALTVPSAAIERRGQLQSLFVLEGDRLRRRLVTVGAESGGRAEVLSGLSAGERVVVRPPAGLVDGARAQATSEARP